MKDAAPLRNRSHRYHRLLVITAIAQLLTWMLGVVMNRAHANAIAELSVEELIDRCKRGRISRNDQYRLSTYLHRQDWFK